MRIQYIVKNYPQLSQTYIRSEITALINKGYDVNIIATSTPNLPDPEGSPFKHLSEEDEILEEIKKFQPDVIHGHYLVMAETISRISDLSGIPFTIRAHSFDAMINGANDKIPNHIPKLGPLLNKESCRGVLIFPYTRELLVNEGGVSSSKLIDAPPVVDTNHFYNYNTSVNGNGIMNTGAAIPKKSMETFVELSRLMPDDEFNLYGMGHNIDEIKRLNAEIGGQVNFIDPIPYSKMPSEYKKHKALVYTANMKMKTVGWPMAVIEAMASGTMVYMPNIREDVKDYVGDAGYLYDDVADIVELLQSPVDEKKRAYAFEYARQFDIADKIKLLTDLWDSSEVKKAPLVRRLFAWLKQ